MPLTSIDFPFVTERFSDKEPVADHTAIERTFERDAIGERNGKTSRPIGRGDVGVVSRKFFVIPCRLPTSSFVVISCYQNSGD
jgi:hypothetical protein